MARPVRMDYPDTFYHVLSRGNERRRIFRESRDYEKFTENLGRMVERYQIELHAYVLMTNHYHLLIRTRQANLSKAIQWLGLSYSIWFNRRYKRNGHLFQGRFKSFVIEDERYFTAMCLYIHRNPLRAGLADNLLDYRWSSYPAYIGAARNTPWLTTSLVLGLYGGSRKVFKEAQQAYAKEEKDLVSEIRYGLFLGSDEFVNRMKENLEKESHPEKPQVRMAFKEAADREEGISEALDRVLSVLGIEDRGSLLRPMRRSKRPERDLAIYILSHQGRFTHKEVGRLFGVGYTSITEAMKRAHSYMEADPRMKNKVERALIDI